MGPLEKGQQLPVLDSHKHLMASDTKGMLVLEVVLASAVEGVPSYYEQAHHQHQHQHHRRHRLVLLFFAGDGFGSNLGSE